jgi:diaminohydroxyphosphoribosylaminopyrimidine deaminase/5-amino-6-(5-phosphoribosylamino)uracil reductase
MVIAPGRPDLHVVDQLHMARALALAERGRGRTNPNPMVGAVVVDAEGVVVGRGSHEYAGGPHAEIHALAEAGERARGATLYCTLEPCSHTGRTGPCAPRVVEAGIRRAVIAVQDPNPLVSGRGMAYLRERGVEVAEGVHRAAATALNAPFFSVIRRGRPFVTMKIALSQDDRVAAGPGVRTSLTGPAANRYIHRERAEVDALAVGSASVLVDDPLLTARGAYRLRPLIRLIFDRRLRTPPAARLLSTLESGPIIIVGVAPRTPAGQQRADALARAGAGLQFVADPASGGFLRTAFSSLPALGVMSVIVEGGPTLHGAIWEAGLVDRVQVFRTPRTLGEAGVPWVPGRVALEALTDERTVVLGDDVLIEGHVHRID